MVSAERLEGFLEIPQNKETAQRTPTITLVICTRNNPDVLLRDAITSIYKRAQQLDNSLIETLIVDQSTDGETERVLENSPFGTDPKARYVHMDAKGLSRARNVAIQMATGDVITFIDDDIKVRPGHIDTISKNFAENPGMVMSFAPVHPDKNAYAEALKKDANVDIPRFEPSETIIKKFHGNVFDIKTGIGANMAVRRDVALKYLFDEELGAGAPDFRSHEEIDFALRVFKEGTIGVFMKPIVDHTGARAGNEVNQLKRDTVKGDVATKMKVARENGSLKEILKVVIPGKIAGMVIKNLIKKGRPEGAGRLIAHVRALLALRHYKIQDGRYHRKHTSES